MANYGVVTSQSQAHTSKDDSSDHSPQSVATLCTAASSGGDDSSKQLFTPSSSDNTDRKPRGRPPGSKNKPKPQIVINKDSDSTMKPVILEISAGADIMDSIIGFARRNNVGVCAISASGSVASVTLRNPNSHGPALSFQGPFGLISFSGSYVASTAFQTPQTMSYPPFSFGVILSGGQGQLFGGTVGGKMVAATRVTVTATTFTNPSFHKLPCEDTTTCGHGGSREASNGVSISGYGAASPAPNVMPWPPSSRPH